MSYPALAAIRASYTYLQCGKTEVVSMHQSLHATHHKLTSILQLCRNLEALTTHLHDQLQHLLDSIPVSVDSPLLSIPPSPPQSPIFSLLTPWPKQLAAYCQQHGYVVRGIVPPTVPEGAERVRICLHAGNTVEEIEGLVRVVGLWAKQHASPQILTQHSESQNAGGRVAKSVRERALL